MIEIIEDSDFIIVSIIDMKQYLRIEHDHLDGVIINYIKLATRFVERMIGKSFLIKTYRYYWKQTMEMYTHQAIKMPICPIADVVNIKNMNNQTRLKRYVVELGQFITVHEMYNHLEIIYKAGMSANPKDIHDEYKNLVCLVTQAMFEEKDIENHPCMKVLKCYKENSCISI